MWYSSTLTGRWTINLAESNDGINWTPYENNPVLKGDAAWDGSQVGGPAVIFDNGLFHMWYNSNTGIPSRINYAYSTDGKNWIKPPEKNPVIDTDLPGTWEADGIGDPAVIKLGDRILLWYGAGGTVNGINAARIGLASDIPFTIPIVTPTVTPTPAEGPTPTDLPTPTLTSTPTPTPAPEPTITPTPTTIPVKKVVILPGFGGSWNQEAFTKCTQNSDSPWQLLPVQDASETYDPLIRAIGDSGFIPLVFYYDWRANPEISALKFKNYLNKNTNPTEKIYAVSHSLGGLIARKYIETEQNQNKISILITAGTPHFGMLPAYPAWSAGEVTGDWKWVIGSTIIKSFCKMNGYQTLNDREIVQKFIPSVHSLLPVFNYLKDFKSGAPVFHGEMTATNNWLTDNPIGSPYFGTRIITISGQDNNTPLEYLTKPNQKFDQLLGNWTDGKIQKTVYSKQGDGSILNKSSRITGAENISVTQNHGGVISSEESISKILSIFGSTTQKSALYTDIINDTDPENMIAIVSDNLTPFSLENQAGVKINSVAGLIMLAQPNYGYYKFRLNKPEIQTRLIVYQIKNKDKVLWHEYSFEKISAVNKTLHFLESSDESDILTD